jgi:hypothetical protein
MFEGSDSEFLQSLGSLEDAERFRTLYNDSLDKFSRAATKFNERQDEATGERTGFFEKLAIGSGATIAAIVSFLGSKAHTLEPRWALRTGVCTLAGVIVTALARNYLYPYYFHHALFVPLVDAQIKRDKHMQNYLEATPNAVNLETGRPFDGQTMRTSWDARRESQEELKKNTEKLKDRYFFWWRRCEDACLLLVAASIVMLVLLVWWNF